MMKAKITPFLQSLILHSLCMLCISILSYSSPLAQGGEPEYVLTSQDIEVYYDIVEFLIDRSLNDSEKEQLKTYIEDSFSQKPEQTLWEINSLNYTLKFLAENPNPLKQLEVKNNFMETLNSYVQKGKHNAITNIVQRNN